MKNIAILLIVILGIGLISSCKKEVKDPVLDMSLTVPATITSPSNGSSFEFTEDNQDSVLTFTWTKTQYNLQNLETITYLLQMAKSGTDFESTTELTSTTGTSYETTYGAINARLLIAGDSAGVAVSYDFRVVSYINNTSDYSNANSATNTTSLVPFEKVITITPVYLLGSATTVGWDNTAALPFTYLEEGKFAIVETLTPVTDAYMKILSDLGQWAPQWGTDDAGTSESGNLVYRPTEDVADPPGIPAPAEEGDYYIMADTANLTYDISKTSATLFLVGDATDAGWDNTMGIEFTKDSPGMFSLTTNLGNSGGMKFLEVSGAWAPQWGTDDSGTADSGTLIYRPDEATDDPVNIPAPSSAGEYTIKLNLVTKTYSITAK